MIAATQLRPGMVVKFNNELFSVFRMVHRTPGNLRGFVQARMRSLRSGSMIEHRFSSEDKVERIALDEHEMEYLYDDGEYFYFMNTVPQHVFRKMHLFVILSVHEVKVLAVVVQILHLMLIKSNALNLIFGREPVFDHGSGPKIPHLGLNEAAQVAGRAVDHAEDRVQLIVELNHHAWAQLCRCDH